MGNDERKIDNTTFVLMLCVAVCIDSVQFALNFLLIIGWIIIWMMNVLAWLTFYLWFKIKGVNFSNPKRGLSLFGGFLIELIPVINALPAWTMAVVLIAGSSRAEELAAKLGVPDTALKAVGKTGKK